MRQLLISVLVGLGLMGGLLALMPMGVSAQSADASEQSAANCRASGGSWDGTRGVCVRPGCDNSGSFLGFPTWHKYLEIGEESVTSESGVVIVSDPCAIIGPKTDGEVDWEKALPRIALAVVEILLRISAVVAVAYVMYGGFRYIISQGEPENAKSARQTIMNALIGLVIALLATGIVAFVGTQLIKSATITQQSDKA